MVRPRADSTRNPGPSIKITDVSATGIEPATLTVSRGAASGVLLPFRERGTVSRIGSVMLGFAHPAMLPKDAEAFTVAYPWAKPAVVGWASADPSGLGRLFSGGTTTQRGIARID